jgi:hypothetical protein
MFLTLTQATNVKKKLFFSSFNNARGKYAWRFTLRSFTPKSNVCEKGQSLPRQNTYQGLTPELAFDLAVKLYQGQTL